MQSRIVVFVLAVIALGLGSQTASAQQTESRIVGTIADPNGGILPGVAVTVTAASTGAVRTAVSDGQGRYTVSNLAPGTYQVALELSGFAPTRRDITLGVGDAKAVDVAMPVAGVTEAVHGNRGGVATRYRVCTHRRERVSGRNRAACRSTAATSRIS